MQCHPIGVIEPLAGGRDDVVFDLDVLDQDLQHALGHGRFHLQQRRRAVAELLEGAIDGFEQIVGAVLGHLHVAVANDPKQVRASDLDAGEQLAEVHPDDVLQKGERLARRAGRRAMRDRHEARQARRHLHARELRPPAVADDDREVLAAAGNQRKRVTRIEGQRRQQRKDLRPEVRRQESPRRVGELVGLENPDAVLGERRAQTVVPARGLIAHHHGRPLADGGQLLGHRHAVDRDLLEAGAPLLEQRRHTNHEEFVEVRADDGQELHALQQRMVVVERLIEDSLVELQPAQLAVAVQRWIVEIGGRDEPGSWRLDSSANIVIPFLNGATFVTRNLQNRVVPLDPPTARRSINGPSRTRASAVWTIGRIAAVVGDPLVAHRAEISAALPPRRHDRRHDHDGQRAPDCDPDAT